ncbi:MAG: type II toxin-antitoxin system Phd/YefM family antitoxin [Chloroflexota bacterium]
METVNVYEAKTHLSKLLERVERGETVVIARAGKPVALLSPFVDPATQPRKLGIWAGQGWISEDFDDPLPEFEETT